MTDRSSDDLGGPPIVVQFYYSRTLPYLTIREKGEIDRRLHEVPAALRQRELAPRFAALGETSGDAPWQVLRDYLETLERSIAEIVRRHSPSFWFHLHRRIAPMLSSRHEGKTDDTTVALVRRIAELAYAKHGDLQRHDDLGPIIKTQLKTFLGGAWYEATAQALQSKLKAQQEYRALKRTPQVVMTDFEISDLHDVYGVEGLCYEYWWASAAMRSIGKGSMAKWDGASAAIVYRDDTVHPMCFEIYDRRNEEKVGFHTRLGTWIDENATPDKNGALVRDEEIYFAQLTPNPAVRDYPIWNAETKSLGRGVGATNFAIGTFSLAEFRRQNRFMAEAFHQKHGIALDSVLFALWTASFFGVFTGMTSRLASRDQRFARTMANWGNLLFRGYAMTVFDLASMAKSAVWFATELGYEHSVSVEQAQQGLEFIALSEAAQQSIALWSGGKRPILLPSLDGLMIDMAATMPFLYTIFFGLRKVPQVGGTAFEDSVREGLRARGFDVCLQGELRWPSATPREVDAAVRIGDRLILLECFSYEMPLDYEVGKPSVFETRKKFIVEKLKQAETLAERVRKEPKGSNFDVSWAREIEWRVVSPFVEFAWELNEPFFDADGLPRLLQVRELMDYVADGRVPAASCAPLLKAIRQMTPKGIWY